MSRSAFINPGNTTGFVVDESLRNWIIEIRRHIHQYPELSFEEYRTAAFIQEKLAELGVTAQGDIAKTGVVAYLGENNSGVGCVALRADMDGLPVHEETGLSFSSTFPGIMHACGHDGHVAMLLGAAALLKQCEELPGSVKLLFQPAEERGNGALRFVEAGVLDDVAAVFGGHIDTHYETGQITVDEGLICASSDPFTIEICGKGGHAARPHEAKDAIVAGSSLVTQLQTLVSREVNPNRAQVITIGSFNGGRVHNIIAGKAILKGTLRSTDTVSRKKALAGIQRMVDGIGSLYGVGTKLTFEEELPAVINSEQTANIARVAAWEATAVDKVISQGDPSLGSEDFSYYQKIVQGCMVRFGARLEGSVGPAHSNTFDFDERCLEFGARWLAAVALQWFRQNESVPALKRT